MTAFMGGADSNNDRDLIRRLTIVILLGFLFTAGFTHLNRVYGHKFYDVTGRAEWIWARQELSREIPVAFFAARDFDLPPNRYYTHIKVAGDPEYTLYFNGRTIGGRRFGDQPALDVYDVSELARTGRNRIVIAARSTNGVGGVIAAVDIAPEVANYVVTDGGWKIFRTWSPEIPVRDPAVAEPPILFGQPPMGRWNYLARLPAAIAPEAHAVLRPVQEFRLIGQVPKVKIRSGVAVAGVDRVRATAFDFGRIIDGRVRLTLTYDSAVPHEVNVRFANTADELPTVEGGVTPFVFAGRERTIVDPETRHFRYVMVYGGQATAEVVE